MVLNHASLDGSLRETIQWLGEMARGMAALVDAGVVEPSLRTFDAPTELRSPGEWSLFDAYLGLNRVDGMREEGTFVLRLASKTPLLSDVAERTKSRFLACEARDCVDRGLSTSEGKPLLLCAVSDGVAVSFPSEPIWDRDFLTVRFQELLPNEKLHEAEEKIDNVARSGHAQPILERHRASLTDSCRSGRELWAQRRSLYPHLLFGPDVEANLDQLDAGLLFVVLKRLRHLDEAADQWETGPAPDWPCRVTPESESTMSNAKRRRARCFRSVNGNRELFEWHARFGNSGRIHLRFEARERLVEIGYIGMHLPI